VLGVIQDWYLRESKPPLTILVISQDKKQPGQEFIACDTRRLEEGYEEAYAYPWHFCGSKAARDKACFPCPQEVQDLHRVTRFKLLDESSGFAGAEPVRRFLSAAGGVHGVRSFIGR
jgi:hypothetical protein